MACRCFILSATARSRAWFSGLRDSSYTFFAMPTSAASLINFLMGSQYPGVLCLWPHKQCVFGQGHMGTDSMHAALAGEQFVWVT